MSIHFLVETGLHNPAELACGGDVSQRSTSNASSVTCEQCIEALEGRQEDDDGE